MGLFKFERKGKMEKEFDLPSPCSSIEATGQIVLLKHDKLRRL